MDSNLGSVTDVWGQTEVILDFMEILFLFLITSYTRGGRKERREGGKKKWILRKETQIFSLRSNSRYRSFPK